MNIIKRGSSTNDVKVFYNRSQMVDNLEVHSTASSDISDSLREQILGKAFHRRRPNRPNPKKTVSQRTLRDSPVTSYEVVPSKEAVNFNQTKDLGGDRQSLSHHTPKTVSDRSLLKSFEVVPEHSSFEIISKNLEKSSMQSTDRQFNTVETQTVAIQTVSTGIDADWECRCFWGDNECGCHECEPQNCRYGYSKKRTLAPPEETSDPSNYTESSSQTVDMRRRNECSCRRRKKWEESSLEFSESDESYTSEFFDLPYQNNEEYLKLLRELEKKLIARNRERVRKTMMEFERRSRQNKNLDRPICDYSDDNATILKKLSSRNRKSPVCCKCGRNKRVNSDILQNEKRWDEINFVQSVIQDSDPSCPPLPNGVERSLHKSHWQLDPRSGEWVKVSSFQQTGFSRPQDDYKKVPPPGSMCKKECYCRQKKRHL